MCKESGFPRPLKTKYDPTRLNVSPDERLPHAGVLQPEIRAARDGGVGALLCRCDDGQHGAVPESDGELPEIPRGMQVSKAKLFLAKVQPNPVGVVRRGTFADLFIA